VYGRKNKEMRNRIFPLIERIPGKLIKVISVALIFLFPFFAYINIYWKLSINASFALIIPLVSILAGTVYLWHFNRFLKLKDAGNGLHVFLTITGYFVAILILTGPLICFLMARYYEV
jgi:hypothetical protein